MLGIEPRHTTCRAGTQLLSGLSDPEFEIYVDWSQNTYVVLILSNTDVLSI